MPPEVNGNTAQAELPRAAELILLEVGPGSFPPEGTFKPRQQLELGMPDREH